MWGVLPFRTTTHVFALQKKQSICSPFRTTNTCFCPREQQMHVSPCKPTNTGFLASKPTNTCFCALQNNKPFFEEKKTDNLGNTKIATKTIKTSTKVQTRLLKRDHIWIKLHLTPWFQRGRTLFTELKINLKNNFHLHFVTFSSPPKTLLWFSPKPPKSLQIEKNVIMAQKNMAFRRKKWF